MVSCKIQFRTFSYFIFILFVFNGTTQAVRSKQSKPTRLSCTALIHEADVNENRLQYLDTDLLKKVIEQQQEGNIVISPLTIKILMALLQEGSGGDTAKELQEVLRLPQDTRDKDGQIEACWMDSLSASGSDLQLASGTKLFLSKGYKVCRNYEQKIHDIFRGSVENIDVSDGGGVAVTSVNSWVKSLTGGLIPSLLTAEQVNPNTAALVVSAIYFKGAWRHKFQKASKSSCFYKTAGECSKLYFLEASQKFRYGYVSAINSDAIEIPYKNPRFSMLIIVPRGSMETLASDLLRQHVPGILKTQTPSKIKVCLPSFTASYQQDFVPILRELQVNAIFGSSSNISGITKDGSPLTVTNIIHASHVMVTDVGTEAGSVAGAAVSPLMKDEEPFKVDKPFFFFIKDTKTENTLFSGRITEPDLAEEIPALPLSSLPPRRKETPRPILATQPTKPGFIFASRPPLTEQATLEQSNDNDETDEAGDEAIEPSSTPSPTKRTLTIPSGHTTAPPLFRPYIEMEKEAPAEEITSSNKRLPSATKLVFESKVRQNITKV